jgi:carbonic anhydrase
MRAHVCSILAFASLFLCTVTGQEAHWGYSGATGPEHWAEFGATCASGKAQSPIDIVHPDKKGLSAIEFAYHPSPLKIINNGHSIQVNYGPGSSITLNGKSYQLQQFHFHHQSENELNGRHMPMELHLVHVAQDGSLAVVAVFLKEGHANSTVSTLWSNLPPEMEKEYAPEGVEIDAAGLLPPDHRYETFPGSLTTPPCTEGVTWVVLEKPATLSKEQIAKFAAIYPNNARPVQPLNGRVISESK